MFLNDVAQQVGDEFSNVNCLFGYTEWSDHVSEGLIYGKTFLFVGSVCSLLE